jgi:hypothetical protein
VETGNGWIKEIDVASCQILKKLAFSKVNYFGDLWSLTIRPKLKQKMPGISNLESKRDLIYILSLLNAPNYTATISFAIWDKV